MSPGSGGKGGLTLMSREPGLALTLFTLGGPRVVFLSATKAGQCAQADASVPSSARTRSRIVQRRRCSSGGNLHWGWGLLAQPRSLQFL